VGGTQFQLVPRALQDNLEGDINSTDVVAIGHLFTHSPRCGCEICSPIAGWGEVPCIPPKLEQVKYSAIESELRTFLGSTEVKNDYDNWMESLGHYKNFWHPRAPNVFRWEINQINHNRNTFTMPSGNYTVLYVVSEGGWLPYSIGGTTPGIRHKIWKVGEMSLSNEIVL